MKTTCGVLFCHFVYKFKYGVYMQDRSKKTQSSLYKRKFRLTRGIDASAERQNGSCTSKIQTHCSLNQTADIHQLRFNYMGPL